MAIIKCKMCGGDLVIEQGSTVAECEYCGTQQTLPRLDNEKKLNLYDRANHFRRNNEFDKAMGIYEQILNEDNTDSEAYWSLVLCKYGIEYVEESGKRVPTVNRAQFTSVLADEDYKSAIQYADVVQKSIYEAEAKAIDEIQKGILAISQKEEPFDVFICYKETDNNGRRTPDSVLATELYHELTKEGFKVFFARITLEDKLGTAYEPYIFAALNSSKVMVALGTKPEYFNAVWVKNEWSRYLSLIKNGAKKMLIPAYRDMDPYDLPEEFSHLQAQDMSKLGFMQDLVRGITKIVSVEKPQTETVVKQTIITEGNANTAPLLKRAFMFLEDGDWTSANEYCEKVLDLDPENAEAYLGKLMAELRVRKKEQLKDCKTPFEERNNCQKAMRFGDEAFTAFVMDCTKYINERNENERLTNLYNNAVSKMNSANTETEFKSASALFDEIKEFKDSELLSKQCLEKAEIARKDEILLKGKNCMIGGSVSNYNSAIEWFKHVEGWKDADDKIEICEKKIEEIKAKEEADRLEKERKAEIERKEAEQRAKRNKKIVVIVTSIVCIVVAFFIILNSIIIPNKKYDEAIALMQEGRYEEAITAFEELDGYKDSEQQILNYYIELCGEEIGLKVYNQLKIIKIGDTFTYGIYENKAIEWKIVEKQGSSLCLVSEKALLVKPFDEDYEAATWETSSIREWLNGEFLASAFTESQQLSINTTHVIPDANPEYSTYQGEDTYDKIYLLSLNEVNKYFPTQEDRKCSPLYTGDVHGSIERGTGYCRWGLRTMGANERLRVDINGYGGISYYGDSNDKGIRPAMWIDLSLIED